MNRDDIFGIIWGSPDPDHRGEYDEEEVTAFKWIKRGRIAFASFFLIIVYVLFIWSVTNIARRLLAHNHIDFPLTLDIPFLLAYMAAFIWLMLNLFSLGHNLARINAINDPKLSGWKFMAWRYAKPSIGCLILWVVRWYMSLNGM